MKAGYLSAFLLSATILSPIAMASQSSEDEKRPSFKGFRFDEDWSKFNAKDSDNPLDQIKHISLSDDDSVWLSLGGELRLRNENWTSFGFSDAPDRDDNFILGRLKLHADLHLGERIRFFIEGESAMVTDRDLPGGRRTLDVDELDLQNAFVDFLIPLQDSSNSVTLRLGRQGLSFGKQRLVSTLPWANSQRSWDGGRVILNYNNWRVDTFYTRFTPVQKYQFNDWLNGPDFWGIYATGKIGEKDQIGIDLYYLGIQYDGIRTYNGTAGKEDRHTVGARAFGKIADSGLSFDVEAAYQFGEVGTSDISAYMFASKLSYGFSSSEWKPSIYIGYDYSSGDDNPGDSDVETFNQLFPLGHAYNGFMDLIGRQNIQDIYAGVSFKPHTKLLVKLDYHVFSRSSDSDSVYNAGGGILRATTPGASNSVGQEIDLTVKLSVNRHLTFQVGYSHFFAGDYFTDTSAGTADEDVDFVYAQAVFKF